jgi:ferredoxin-nitrate reductase
VVILVVLSRFGLDEYFKLEDINLVVLAKWKFLKMTILEEIVFSDLKKRYYKKCIVKNDLLVGNFDGETNEFAEFKP